MGALEAGEELGEVGRGPQDVAVDFGDDGAAGLEEAGRYLAGHAVICEDDVDLFGVLVLNQVAMVSMTFW